MNDVNAFDYYNKYTVVEMIEYVYLEENHNLYHTCYYMKDISKTIYLKNIVIENMITVEDSLIYII